MYRYGINTIDIDYSYGRPSLDYHIDTVHKPDKGQRKLCKKLRTGKVHRTWQHLHLTHVSVPPHQSCHCWRERLTELRV